MDRLNNVFPFEHLRSLWGLSLLVEGSSNQSPVIFSRGREEREKEKLKLRYPYNCKHVKTNKKFVLQMLTKILI